MLLMLVELLDMVSRCGVTWTSYILAGRLLSPVNIKKRVIYGSVAEWLSS